MAVAQPDFSFSRPVNPYTGISTALSNIQSGLNNTLDRYQKDDILKQQQAQQAIDNKRADARLAIQQATAQKADDAAKLAETQRQQEIDYLKGINEPDAYGVKAGYEPLVNKLGQFDAPEYIRNLGTQEDKKVMVNGKEVPILQPEVFIEVKNKLTGKEYESPEEAKKDIADPTTDTQEEHIEQNVEIKVQQLPDFKGEIKYD